MKLDEDEDWPTKVIHKVWGGTLTRSEATFSLGECNHFLPRGTNFDFDGLLIRDQYAIPKSQRVGAKFHTLHSTVTVIITLNTILHYSAFTMRTNPVFQLTYCILKQGQINLIQGFIMIQPCAIFCLKIPLL